MDHEPLRAVVVGTGFGVLTHARAMQAAGRQVSDRLVAATFA